MLDLNLDLEPFIQDLIKQKITPQAAARAIREYFKSHPEKVQESTVIAQREIQAAAQSHSYLDATPSSNKERSH